MRKALATLPDRLLGLMVPKAEAAACNLTQCAQGTSGSGCGRWGFKWMQYRTSCSSPWQFDHCGCP